MPTPEVLSTNVLHRYRIFAIVEKELRLPSGRTVARQVVQHPSAVVVIPQLADGRLLLVEQYRFAVGETLLEFPAGTLEPDEAPLDCAKRELLEETGYRADHRGCSPRGRPRPPGWAPVPWLRRSGDGPVGWIAVNQSFGVPRAVRA